MQYIIGVDAGGTSCKADSYNLSGSLLYSKKTSFGNFAVDIQKTKLNIEEAIDLLMKEHTDDELMGIYLGVSGVGSYAKKEEYSRALSEKYQTHVELYSDIKLAKEASLQGQDGIMLVVGTGFSCLGSYQGNELLYGGWGHIIGDPCSGYAIGLASIRNAILEYEMGKLSQFSKKVMQFYEISQINDFKEIVYQYPKDKVASVAKLVIEEMHDNQSAFSIIVDEINKMMEIIERLCQSLGYKKELHIAGVGSIFENIAMIKMIIETNLYNYDLIWHDFSNPTYGSYILYQSHK